MSQTNKITLTREFQTKSGKQLTLGIGTGTKWKDLKRSTHSKKEVEPIIEAITSALEVGYNHIDGAEAYATHPEIATAVSRSGRKRQDIWITTKYGVGSKNFPAKSKGPLDFLDKALKELQTDYIDLLLIHHPFIDKEHSFGNDLETIWKELESAKDQGKVREIGVSNFRVQDIEKIVKTGKYKPVVNQIEFHPYLQNQSDNIVSYCQENNILVEAYGPLSPLRVAEEDIPSKSVIFHPLKETLKELSSKLNKTEAQILLRYTLEKGILPISTTSKKERNKQAIDVYKFSLDDEIVHRIDKDGAQFPRRFYFQGFFL